jgi:hypothetical protein
VGRGVAAEHIRLDLEHARTWFGTFESQHLLSPFRALRQTRLVADGHMLSAARRVVVSTICG